MHAIYFFCKETGFVEHANVRIVPFLSQSSVHIQHKKTTLLKCWCSFCTENHKCVSSMQSIYKEYLYTYNPSSYVVQYFYSIKSWKHLNRYKKERIIIYVPSMMCDAGFICSHIIHTQCHSCMKRVFWKGSESDNMKKESSWGSPFVFLGKTSTCSVSCSELFITVTVLTSNQTAFAKVSTLASLGVK